MIRYAVVGLLLFGALFATSCDSTEERRVDGGPCSAVNPKNGACWCTSNAECGADQPYCDPKNGVCRGCAANSECAGRADAPVCDTGSGTCVACVTSNDCGSAAVHVCDQTSHTCSGCASNAECTDAAKPICDEATGACRGCAADADCAGNAAATVCDEASGKCVACTTDTEAEQCGVKSCDRMTMTCTGTNRLSLTRCATCQADSECLPEHVCVARPNDLGKRCLPVAPQTGCGTELMLPYWRSIEATSVDGVTGHICSPRDTISCEAIRSVGSLIPECATTSPNGEQVDACGNATLHDGVCYSADSASKCSYRCVDSSDCKKDTFCESTSFGWFCH